MHAMHLFSFHIQEDGFYLWRRRPLIPQSSRGLAGLTLALEMAKRFLENTKEPRPKAVSKE